MSDRPVAGGDISLKAGERAILLGKTGTGKSTLATHIVRTFLGEYPTANVLIVDSKPRYRASFHPNGVKARYKNWVDGDVIDGSVALAAEDLPLKQVFLHSRVVILQSRTTAKKRVPGYPWRVAEYADQFFQMCGKKTPGLFFIDEFYDVVGPTGHADPRILSTIREGRETNLAVMAGAQRPRAIPVSILSEATNYYIFFLDYKDDLKRISDFGPPVALRPVEHQFLFHRNLKGSRHTQFLAELKVAS